MINKPKSMLIHIRIKTKTTTTTITSTNEINKCNIDYTITRT